MSAELVAERRMPLHFSRRSHAARGRQRAATSTIVRVRMPCAPWISTPSMSAVADGPVMKTRVARSESVRLAIGVVQVGDDGGRVEQHDEVLRQEAERVDARTRARSARPSRSRRRRTTARTTPTSTSSSVGRVAALGRCARVPFDLGHGRADDCGARDAVARTSASRSMSPAGGRPPCRPCAGAPSLNAASADRRAAASKGGIAGSGRRRRLVAAHARQDVLAAGAPRPGALPRFFRYHWRNVDVPARPAPRAGGPRR